MAAGSLAPHVANGALTLDHPRRARSIPARVITRNDLSPIRPLIVTAGGFHAGAYF